MKAVCLLLAIYADRILKEMLGNMIIDDSLSVAMYLTAIDIADGPSFLSDGPTETPTQHYAILGDHSSLICGRGLDSNPQATITWTGPDGTTIVDDAIDSTLKMDRTL